MDFRVWVGQRPTVRAGVEIGTAFGALAALPLVVLALPGDEAAEAASMFAAMLSYPASEFFWRHAMLDRLIYAIPLILRTLVSNGVLVGVSLALVAMALRLQNRWLLAALPLAIAVLTVFRVLTSG